MAPSEEGRGSKLVGAEHLREPEGPSTSSSAQRVDFGAKKLGAATQTTLVGLDGEERFKRFPQR